MLNYVVKKISQVEKNDLYSFYKIVFKDRYKILFENLKWWYRLKNSNCEPIVLTLENKIIGQLGTIPTKIKIENKIKTAVWYVDYAVLKEFQGKGAGSKLVKEGTQLSEIQIAFCNEAALRVYKKLGWQINYFTKRLGRPINPIRWIPLIRKSNLKILRKIYNFSLRKKLKDESNINPIEFIKNSKEILENFLKRKNSLGKSIEFFRDAEWFNWRFTEFPFKKDLKLFELNGNYVIAHFLSLKNIKRLHVLFHFYLDHSEEKKIYYSIAKWAIENDFDLIWSCSANQNLINDLIPIFPKKFIKPITIASFSSDKLINEKLNKNFNNIQAADSDMDTFFLKN